VSRNDDALKKVSSNIKDQFPKNNEETISKSPVPSQFPLVPSKGDPSQKVEELSSSLLVMRELEQLVTKKHLDDENLCLLNDFLVNHPSVLLRDTSLSNKYKGYAYNCLAELLKFLKTHSVLEAHFVS
ncbi:putative CC-NBS-LRR resistance protein, partial [Trifolium pratense]